MQRRKHCHGQQWVDCHLYSIRLLPSPFQPWTYLPFPVNFSVDPRRRTLRIDAINLFWKLSAARPMLTLFLGPATVALPAPSTPSRARSACRNLSMSDLERINDSTKAGNVPSAETCLVTPEKTQAKKTGRDSSGTGRPTAPESCSSPALQARGWVAPRAQRGERNVRSCKMPE